MNINKPKQTIRRSKKYYSRFMWFTKTIKCL